MHIVDGALSNPVVIGGAVLAIGGLAMGLKDLTLERIPAAGVLSASFFVASLIHVPIGPSSVHLILNGLAGLVLGWAAFPALFVGLLLQAVFFGFGGLTVLGVNAVNIALPAVLVGLAFRPLVARGSPRQGAIWGGIGGGMAIAATTIAVAISLALTGDEFLPAAKLVFFAHIPVMVIEALLSGAAIFLARRVKPELFMDVKGGLT
ncbi:cobalt transporter CbiM (plasmid) [Aliiroseovarius crassostreae]|uniref:Cobalt transporter CbiM n=1 Tax=Aliiroseovarius crassostreae TaxID=154981 RepID=A0A9Q9HH23_9RHOB|nr:MULTISPECIES: cobalt transporter CbiM [Aliiroseovarius]NRP14329.1 Fused nickel transport protein NikMN [Aliiroseovarius sp. xm-d-517]NRP42482.1 Fused nickel transport protein NikMN [Aliiroseovarius sp. xm-m-339-2]NRP63326.1 Fused nickel transport protein NikMN [Aliiroseovarius sp. xm-a-151]NRQ25441.1 Fused nickel transport protein NikMN [Aliiroseovarius sp. xm-g-7]UWP93997.1 cobalt transporter CbiM [Aliiroseovarius crassostreae]